MLNCVLKRNGETVRFDASKITNAIFKAGESTKEFDKETSECISTYVTDNLDPTTTYSIEQIQDRVEKAIMEFGFHTTAKAYIVYREHRANVRRSMKVTSNELVSDYIENKDWRVKENANMGFSLQGLNNHISGELSKNFWLNQVYTPAVAESHEKGDIHIHDLNLLSVYCVGWDLPDLLASGFTGVEGKISSRPAKHFRAALGQIVNFLYTLQGEAAGAQAFSNFDTLLAPFVKLDNLTYKEVRQAMQEFIYNMNVPTRVGFQCLSDDTEILTEDGWRPHHQVHERSIIATFNMNSHHIEYLPVKKMFSRDYSGVMYNLRNRITDQLLSPAHRIVRCKYPYGSENYVFETVEDAISSKSPIIVPVGSKGNQNGVEELDDDMVKLMAWIIADGSCDKNGRGIGRVTIYQSKIVNPQKHSEITDICKRLNLTYSEYKNDGVLGQPVDRFRFSSDANKFIYELFGSDKVKGLKYIPLPLLKMNTRQSLLFLETYLKADGCGNVIVTVHREILDGIVHIAANAGFCTSVSIRSNPLGSISKKQQFSIRLVENNLSSISNIDIVDYKGVIWCPSTDNGTVIARRNGKVFITGNCVFSNITMDIKPHSSFAKLPVVIGGVPHDTLTYGDCQNEMNMINKAYLEIMSEGDAVGRIFSFPIPTYNIDKDFDFDDPSIIYLWEATAKYGIPYFANFVNSDMNPEDVRSMCCRLRVDNTELMKRGGGMFGANPLTGSIGVVTINLARLGYLASSSEEFFSMLERRMRIAKESLVIKRKTLEHFTDIGLYPYTTFYLRNIKERFGVFWKNHFSTIGIIGGNEACLNLIGKDIGTDDGREFGIKIMDFMRAKLLEYQDETGDLFNLEATPAEGTGYRFGKLDKKMFPEIICPIKDDDGVPLYSNSTQLPINYTDDLFEVFALQDELQSLYTGGTVVHGFIGESAPDPMAVKEFVRTVCTTFKLPYFTITPSFSVCSTHGYIRGVVDKCPDCDIIPEIYSRIVGYYRPIKQWNDGKRFEFDKRSKFDDSVNNN